PTRRAHRPRRARCTAARGAATPRAARFRRRRRGRRSRRRRGGARRRAAGLVARALAGSPRASTRSACASPTVPSTVGGAAASSPRSKVVFAQRRTNLVAGPNGTLFGSCVVVCKRCSQSSRGGGRTVVRAENGLGRSGFDGRVRDVVPEVLELVVLARLGREDVQHDVEVVGDDPRRIRR